MFPSHDLEEEGLEAYLDKKEELEERSKRLADARAKAKKERKEAEDAELVNQNTLLAEKIPEWFDKKTKRPTDKCSEDMKLIEPYLLDIGMSADDITKSKKAVDWVIYRDAAKYHALQKKKPAVKKQVKKSKSITKGKASAKPAEVDYAKLMYPNM